MEISFFEENIEEIKVIVQHKNEILHDLQDHLHGREIRMLSTECLCSPKTVMLKPSPQCDDIRR